MLHGRAVDIMKDGSTQIRYWKDGKEFLDEECDMEIESVSSFNDEYVI